MHFPSTDLHFEGDAFAANHCGMKRLVHVWLRRGNIILKTSGDWLIHLMNYPERRIAVLHRLDKYSYRKKVIYLVKSLILIDHLSVYTKEMLNAPVYLTVDACSLDMLLDLCNDVPHKRLSRILTECNLVGKLLVYLRLEILK